jgi:hypothetical protein
MNLRLVSFVLCLSLTPLPSAAQAPSTAFQQMLGMGVLAESLTQYCSQKNPGKAQQYQTIFDEWKQRNSWETILSKTNPSGHQSALANGQRLIEQKSQSASILCTDLRTALASPSFDPSKKYPRELAALVSAINKTGSQGSATPQEPQPMQPQQPSTPSSPQTMQPQPQIQTQAQPQPEEMPAPAVQPGGQVQVGDATFSVPANWRPSGKATATSAIFSRPNRDNTMQLFAFLQKPMQGDLKTTLLAEARAAFPGSKPLELKYTYPAKTRTGLDAVYARDGARLRANNKSVAVRAIGIALPNQQFFLVMLVSADSYSLLSNAEDDLAAVVSSMTFRSQNNAAPWDPLTQHGNGGASGLYLYNTVSLMPNPLGGMDMRAQRNYILLFPDGHAYESLPDGGHVLDMDFAATCRDPKKKRYCGTYSLQGGSIRLRWPGDFGLTEESVGSYVAGKSLEAKGTSYYAVAPVHDLRINGRYRSFFAMVGSTVTQSTSVSSEKFITFTPDGRYQKQGFSGASFTNSGAAGTFGKNRAPDAGTYQIDGYTMLLKSQTTGQTEAYSIVVEKPGPNPASLLIDDEAYLPPK